MLICHVVLVHANFRQVFARCLSSLKDERTRASKLLDGPTPKFEGDKEVFLENLEQALYASKIISYAQGFMLIQNAAKDYEWKLNKPEIALMWRGGCIIRSVFLKDITKAYRSNPDLENLLFDDFFNKAIHKAQPGWRDVVSKGALWGIPTPAFSTALSFYDGYRTKDLPANLLQAQRDYFGAHTFRMKPEDATDSKPAGTVCARTVEPVFYIFTSANILSGYPRQLDWPRWQRECQHIHCLVGIQKSFRLS
jgi:6-phosphogluconate dehydrogenase